MGEDGCPVYYFFTQCYGAGSPVSFYPKIPVLLTSQLLLEVLGDKETAKYIAPDIYECRTAIPIPADKNKLGRPLIPVYRGKSPRYKVSYHLKNKQWEKYRDLIKKQF